MFYCLDPALSLYQHLKWSNILGFAKKLVVINKNKRIISPFLELTTYRSVKSRNQQIRKIKEPELTLVCIQTISSKIYVLTVKPTNYKFPESCCSKHMTWIHYFFFFAFWTCSKWIHDKLCNKREWQSCGKNQVLIIFPLPSNFKFDFQSDGYGRDRIFIYSAITSDARYLIIYFLLPGCTHTRTLKHSLNFQNAFMTQCTATLQTSTIFDLVYWNKYSYIRGYVVSHKSSQNQV